RFRSRSSVCRANWCENRIDSTSMPFIRITRVRVYGSTASLSNGSTFSSDQDRNWSSTGCPAGRAGSRRPLSSARRTRHGHLDGGERLAGPAVVLVLLPEYPGGDLVEFGAQLVR